MDEEYSEDLRHMQALVGKLPSLGAYQEALKRSPTATVIIRQDGRLIVFNQRAEFLFDYASGEVLGKPIEVLLPERYREIHQQHREKWFGRPVDRPMGYNMALFGLRKGGIEFPVSVELCGIQTDEGKIGIGYVTERTEPAVVGPAHSPVSSDA